MQSNNVHATKSATATRKHWLTKPLALVTSFFLAISTLVLTSTGTAEQSYGASGGTVSGSWEIGAVTQVFGSYTSGSGLPAVDDQLLYGVQLSNMWSWSLTPDGNSGTLSQIASGAGNSGIERSTLAIDGHRGDRGEGKNVYYFWPWAGSTVLRVEEGSNVADRLSVPSPTQTSPGSLTGWSGGEVIQNTGEIFFSGQEATYLSTSANCNDTAAVSHFTMMILDPKDLTYRASGRICPRTPHDSLNGIVASDMAMDGNGNAYIVVQEAAANTHTLMRVVPAPKDDPTQKWTYNRVQSNIVTETSLSVWGMAFVNGRLYMGRETAATNFAVINPLTGTSQRFTGGIGTSTYTFDFASAQTAFVVDGYVYNDANGNGKIESAEEGLEGVDVAIYRKTGTNYTLEGILETDASGSYSALLGGKGDYIFRVIQPQIDGVNAVQTYAFGETLTDKKGDINSTTPMCYNQTSMPAEYDGPCFGNVKMPAADPPLGNVGSTVTEADIAKFMIYSKASVQSVKDVAEADFGVTTFGSYGDSAVGPATGPTAPAHISGGDPVVWLGAELGGYPGPSNNNTAHNSTDDGVFVESYAGQLPIANSAFLATQKYTLVGKVSGSEAAQAKVKGWTTGVGGNSWNASPVWEPTLAGSTATGDWTPATAAAAGVMHFRAQVSTVDITVPTNATGSYYSPTQWATPGEIEDYLLNVGNSVYHPAARTLAGTGDFKVGPETFTGLTTNVDIRNGIVATANTPVPLQATVPDTTWTVSEILVKDFITGNELGTLPFTASNDRLTWSFTHNPEVDKDVVLEVVFAPSPDPHESDLVVDPDTIVVGGDIKAIVTVRTSERQLLPNVDVTFSKKSGDIILSDTTCKTDAQGQCFVNVSSTKAGVYTDEITATVIQGTAPVPVTGSPATVTFFPGPICYDCSWFVIDPAVSLTDESSWKVADGTDFYTGTLHARDLSNNPILDLDVSKVAFSVTSGSDINISSVANNGDGSYSVKFTTTKLNRTAMAGVKVDGGAVLASDKSTEFLPIPFLFGDIDWTKSTLVVSPTDLGVGEAATATVTVVDKYENPIEGASVVFSLTAVDPAGAHNAVLNPSAGTVLTNAEGKAVVTVTNAKAETVALAATAARGGPADPVSGSPVNIKWNPDVPCADHSDFAVSMTTTGAASVKANGTESWTGKVTARDCYDNLLPNLTPEVLATLQWGVTPAGVTISPVNNAGQGVYTVTYTTTKAGSYTATAHFGTQQVGKNETITFVADVPHPDHIYVSVDPATTAVGTPSKVTVRVNDANDNPIAGLLNNPSTGVSIVGTSGSLPNLKMYNNSTMSETGEGVYEFNVTSEKVGTFTVTATAMGVVATQKPTITFTPGGVSAANSSFAMVDNNALADGTSKNSAKATARDQYDNPVPGATVVVEDKTTDTALTGYLTPRTVTGTTDANGEYMIYWTSNKKGTFTAEGTIDGLRPTTGVMSQITFRTDGVEPNLSEMSVSPQSSIVVGNSFTVTVTLRDANRLLLEDERVEFTLDPASPAELSSSYCMTNANGQCSVAVTSKVAGSYQIHGTVGNKMPIGGDGKPDKASPQTLIFTAGPLCLPPMTPNPVNPANVTRVEVTTPGAEVGGTQANYAMVYAYDCYGNPIEGATVSSSTAVTQMTTTYRTPATGADGTAVIEYRSTLRGSHNAIVSINGTPAPRAISYEMAPRTDGQITLNFGGIPPVAGNSFLAISPTTSQVVGSTFTVTATLRDGYDNPSTGYTISFESDPNLTFSPQASCMSGEDGTCQVTVTSTKANTYEIIGKIAALEVSNRVSATFTPDVLCVSATCETRVEMTVPSAKADGTDRTVATVFARDRYGNAIPNLPVTSTAITAGLTVQSNIASTGPDGNATIWYTAELAQEYQANVTVGGQTPEGSPVTMYFSAGNGFPANSEWDITPAGPLTVGEGAASTYTARAIVRDIDRILVPGEVVTFAIDRPGPVPGPNPNSWSCMTAVDGTCSITIHSTKAGTYSISARLAPGSINNTTTNQPDASRAWKADEVCSATAGCTPVDPTTPNEMRTRIQVKTNNATADGIGRNEVTAYGFDKWGNPVVGARVDSTRVVTGATINIQTGIDPLGEDGSSDIWYTSQVAGDYQVNVAIDDIVPPNSPATLTFVPGMVCLEEAGGIPTGPGADKSKQTRVEVTTNGNQVDKDPNVATAYAFDCTGNAVPNVDFDFVKVVAASDMTIDSTCKTGANGQCTVNATAKTSSDQITNPAEHQARASVGGTELVKHGSPLTFNFKAGEICLAELGMVCEKATRVELLDNNAHVVRGGVTPEDRHLNTVGVYAYDMYGNPLAGVVFDLVADTNDLKFQRGATHQSSIQLTSTAVDAPDTIPVYTTNNEDHWIKASIGGVELTKSGSPLEVWFVDAPEITNPLNGSTIGLSTEIKGTATNANSQVDVYVDGTKVCETTIQADHTWSCPPMKLANGQHVITAQKHSRDGTKFSEVSTPVTVKSSDLAITILHPVREPGEPQVVTGEFFRPGEAVTLVVNSDPLNVGTQTADADGKVTFAFDIPADFAGGKHTATLSAPDSGSIAGTFDVVIPVVPTGGTTQPTSGFFLLLILAAMALPIVALRKPLSER